MDLPVNALWLFTQNLDNWKLVSNSINHNYPYAFIGNGYIGQQVPSEGHGMFMPRINCNQSGCSVHGLYSEEPLQAKEVIAFAKKHFPKNKPLIQESLATFPQWSTLQYFDGTNPYARNIGKHKNYEQLLDLKTATVTTYDEWSSSKNKTTKIKTNFYLARHNRNLAVIKTTFTPLFTGEVSFYDEIDASFLENIYDPQILIGEIISFCGVLGSHKHPISISSKLILPVKTTAEIEIIQSAQKISRRITLQVNKNNSYKITKLVGIYTYQDAKIKTTNSILHSLTQQAEIMLKSAAVNLTAERQKHQKAWKKLWQHHIAVENAPGLQKLINAALYYFYAQLRKSTNWSLGPTGISGSKQWAGIIFWDADLWMAPPLMLINPELARCIIQYRHKTLAGAQLNAEEIGHKGARFAWESTETGKETCFAYTAKQDHAVAAIALTQWQSYITSQDKSYFPKASEIVLQCAQYFASRVKYNKTEDRYEIHNVCCADEYSGIVNNNTLTNYGAVRTLQIAQQILQQQNKTAPQKWLAIINKMYYPYDRKQKLLLEYENYSGQMIKQADTTLLIYPYEMPTNNEQKNLIVEYYRTKYPPEKIMMSSAFDGIIYCEQKKPQPAWHCLLDLLPHFLGPFLVTSETPSNNVTNFITGTGGFLQLIINGFCGIRYRETGLDFHSCLPKEIHSINILGVNYQKVQFDLHINHEEIVAKNFSTKATFNLKSNSGKTITILD